MSKQFGMKEMLLATVCAVGVSGVAQAQFAGSLNVEGIYERGNGGFGGNAGLLLPLFSSPTGMFYTMLEGGWRQGFNHGGSPAGSLGFGYRWLPAGFDGVGIGLNGSFDVSRTRNRNSFYGTTAGLEIFIPGGLSIGLNGYIPLFDKEKKVASSSSSTRTTNLELHDQTPGSCDPTNPTRVCVPVLTGQSVTDSTRISERNRWSADVQVAYRLPFFELIDITPNVSVYMMDRQGKQLKGIDGGLDVALPLAGGVQLTMSAHGRHDREIGTIEEFGVGLRINLGPAGVVSDARQRILAQPPRRLALQDRVRPEVQTETTHTVVPIEEAVKWDKTNATVTELRFVNEANQRLTSTQAANLADGGILIVDGRITLDTAEALTISRNNQGVVGGGSTLHLQGVNSGITVTYLTPGTRGIISQIDPLGPVLRVNGANNIWISNLDLVDGGTGLSITNSQKVTAEDIKINVLNVGLDIADSQNVKIQNFQISSETLGIQLLNADQLTLENGQITTVGRRGRGITITGGSEQVELKNLTFDGVLGRRALTRAVTISDNILGSVSLDHVTLNTWDIGYTWDGVGELHNLGGNTAVNVTLNPDVPDGPTGEPF